MAIPDKIFAGLKDDTLEKLNEGDKSPKGSVDAPIRGLVRLMNSHPNFVTLSSCSGRISLYAAEARATSVSDGVEKRVSLKGSGGWLLAAHREVSPVECYNLVVKALGSAETVLMKHETMIMHILCKTVDEARKLHAVSIDSSFRESGIVLGRRGPVVQIRTTSSLMEVPLVLKGQPVLECLRQASEASSLVSSASDIPPTFCLLVAEANERFRRNRDRTARFFDAFLSQFGHACRAQALPRAADDASAGGVDGRPGHGGAPYEQAHRHAMHGRPKADPAPGTTPSKSESKSESKSDSEFGGSRAVASSIKKRHRRPLSMGWRPFPLAGDDGLLPRPPPASTGRIAPSAGSRTRSVALGLSDMTPGHVPSLPVASRNKDRALGVLRWGAGGARVELPVTGLGASNCGAEAALVMACGFGNGVESADGASHSGAPGSRSAGASAAQRRLSDVMVLLPRLGVVVPSREQQG